MKWVAYLARSDEQFLAAGWPIAGAADLFIALIVARAIFAQKTATTVTVIVALTGSAIAFAMTGGRHLIPEDRTIAKHVMTVPGPDGDPALAGQRRIAVGGLGQRRSGRVR